MSQDAGQNAVFVKSKEMPKSAHVIHGPNFDKVVADFLGAGGSDSTALQEQLLQSAADNMWCSGYQATNVGKAITEIGLMLRWKNEDEDCDPSKKRCKIFLGYTSNMATCGLRDSLSFLTMNSLVQVIVTSGGGVEDDLVQCFGEARLAGPDVDAADHRIYGSIALPKSGFNKMEEWLGGIVDAMIDEQEAAEGVVWAPSTFITRLGNSLPEATREKSITYWAAKNGIPIYCPSITDGMLGGMLLRHSLKRQAAGKPVLCLDLVSDVKRMNLEATTAAHSGLIILGGGLVKHHICNANLMRNGANHAVFINTGQEFDGSDGGARPDEAKSWGKLSADCNSVKIYSEASLVFPMIVQEAFVPFLRERDQS